MMDLIGGGTQLAYVWCMNNGGSPQLALADAPYHERSALSSYHVAPYLIFTFPDLR